MSFTNVRSNNTNKLSPQEPDRNNNEFGGGSNNTNKLSPQELWIYTERNRKCSNNTNKLSPQEPSAIL